MPETALASAKGASTGGRTALPSLAASAGLSPRPQPSSVALPNRSSFPSLQGSFLAPPADVAADRSRPGVPNSWRDRAGPDFDPQQYEQSMKLRRGWDFRLRSDQYASDSEASDSEDLPAVTRPADPQARAEHFARDTEALLARHDGILDASRETPFSQDDYITRLDIRNKDGLCVGLSLRWLQSGHADPQMPASERLGLLSAKDETLRVLKLQSDSNRLHEQLAFHALRPLQELSRSSEPLRGVEFDKYLLCKGGEGVTLSEIADKAARGLLRDDAAAQHLLIIIPSAHAIACEKVDGRFRVFEPNHGVYEAEAGKLGEVLGAVLMNHAAVANLRTPEKALAERIEKFEVRVIPARMSAG